MDWIDVRTAWEHLASRVEPLGTETVPLADAVGRVLRMPVRVDRDLPPFDRAAMDGYAVRAAEVRTASRTAPVTLEVAGESAPGAPYVGAVDQGVAVRIMTGAPLPPDCDAIVPVEESSGFGPARVELYATAVIGAHVTSRGRERRAGESLYAAGRCLSAADVGVLACVGCTTLEVGVRPRIAVLSTGNELVPAGATPGAAEIRDSNAPMLAALARPYGREVKMLARAPDEPRALAARLREGLGFDALIVTGGVSMGAHDHVAAGLEANRVVLHFRRVALQPGKPTGFGTHPGGIVLALPGNPVSALVTFRLFASPALRLQAGETEVAPRWVAATARFSWERQNPKWLVLPGRCIDGPAGPEVERLPYAGSGDLAAYARADCQIVLGPEIARIHPGDAVRIWPF